MQIAPYFLVSENYKCPTHLGFMRSRDFQIVVRSPCTRMTHFPSLRFRNFLMIGRRLSLVQGDQLKDLEVNTIASKSNQGSTSPKFKEAS